MPGVQQAWKNADRGSSFPPRPSTRVSSPDLVKYLDSLRDLAGTKPEGLALEVVNRDRTRDTLSWAELEERTAALAWVLAERYPPGTRLLVMMPAGFDFVVGFLGTLRAGCVAVPVPAGFGAAQVERVEPIYRQSGAVCVLVSSAKHALLDWAEALDISSIDTADAPRGFARTGGAEDLAFLQYTSGSTSDPKGVMVTHRALEANIAQITEAMRLTPEYRVVTWLPPFHDMGLIGTILVPVSGGMLTTIVPPRLFLRDPMIWLEVIAQSDRPVASGGPNFGYDVCVRRGSARATRGWDLSAWRVAFCGAEPIDAEVIRRFTQVYAQRGFDPDAFTPCYGLAEACLLVTCAVPGTPTRTMRLDREGRAADEGAPEDLEVVGLGPAATGVEVEIRDSSGAVLGPRSTGEVYVRGENVTAGYWDAPEATAATFVRRAGTRWLRTGDLGFVDRGELFITGRQKEICIVRGRNFYPRDLEAVISEAHPSVRAAVAISDAGRLVVLGEVERRGKIQRRQNARPESERRQDEHEPSAAPIDLDVVTRTIRVALSDHFGIGPDEVALIRLRSTLHTTSGKKRRRATYDAWRAGKVVSFKHWVAEATPQRRSVDASFPTESTPPPDFIRRRLRRAIADLAQVDESVIEDDTALDTLGLDSVKAIELARGLDVTFGVFVPDGHLIDQTFAELHLAVVRRMLNPTAYSESGELEEESDEGRSLTAAETTMWLSSGVSEVDPALHYHFHCLSEFDEHALRAALEMLLDRHPALRTSYHGVDGSPTAKELSWVEPHFATFRAADPLALAGAVEAFQRARFDLSSGALLRCALIEAFDGVHLCLSVHHIAVDLHSLPLVLRDLSEAYLAARQGKRPAWNEPSASPADFQLWQSWYANSEAGQEAREYWQGQLSLVGDRPLRLASRAVGSALSHESHETFVGYASRLSAVAKAHSTSPQNVLLTCLHVALAKWAGVERASVASTYSARGRARFDELVGFLVNVVPRVLDVPEDASLASLLARNEQRGRDALLHRHYPVASVDDVSRHVGVLFSFDTIASEHQRGLWGRLAVGAEGTTVRIGDVDAVQVTGGSGPSNFDLELLATVAGDDADVHLTWVCSEENRDAGARVRATFLRVLDAVLRDTDRSVQSVFALAPGDPERDRVMDEFQGGPGVAGPDVVTAFRAAAKAHPARVAVRFGGASRTYAALDARTDALAASLRKRGVEPGTRVALFLERSFELIESVWGVWKASASYMPLDSSLPRERLADMLADAAPRVVLTVSALASRIPPGAHEVVILNEALFTPASPPRLRLAPASEAYLIYTSGSTGKPKGVVSHHGGLTLRLGWMQSAFGVGPGDRVAHKTPFAFDVSVWELAWPLLHGATVCVADPGVHGDAFALQRWLEAERVEFVHFVPSMLRAWLDGAAAAGALRTVVCSGEALPSEMADRFARTLPSVRLENLYGPTEASIDVTRAACVSGERVTLGRPAPGVRAYVLDPFLEPCAVGVSGELWLAGGQLAHGYHARPTLTADRFAPDPYGVMGSRMYRTGDRARWNDDGSLEFLGRVDSQVKLRGFRIELGEIEAALEAQSPVTQAVVVVRDDRLCAYVRLEGDADLEGLRAGLALRLPEYMVPASITTVEAFPLTPSGKLDVRSLPDPASLAIGDDEPPQTPDERRLAEVWSEVLGVAGVGRNANFFRSGGDSITAIQLVSRLARVGVAIRVRDVFESPVLWQLATCGGVAVVGDQGRAHGEVLPLPIQERFFTESAGREHYNQALLLDLSESVDAEHARAAIVKLVLHHDALRLRWRETHEGWRGTFGPLAGGVVFAECDVSDLPLNAQPAAIEARCTEAQASLQLTGPMGRAVYFTTGASPRLLLCLHHLVVDAVSWRILLDHLEILLSGADALPLKTTSVAQWGLSLRTETHRFETRRDFWRDVATRARAQRLELGTGAPLERTHRISFTLSAEATSALQGPALAPYSTTVEEVLVASLASALAEHAEVAGSGVVVFMEGHGREDGRIGGGSLDVTSTVGWFTSLYPVVLPVSTDIREQLIGTKEALRRVPDRGLSYGLLAHDDDSLHAPVEVLVNYLGQISLSPRGPSITRVSRETGATSSPQRPTPPLTVEAWIHEGQLVAELQVEERLSARGARLADAMRRALERALTHLAVPGVGERTPTDFELVPSLTARDLGSILEAPREVTEIWPLSPAQHGIYVESLRDPSAYVVQVALEVTGAIAQELPRLREAFDVCVEAHAALRATMTVLEDGTVVQVVRTRELAWEESTADLETWMVEDRRRGFDLHDGPLFRVCVRRVSSERAEVRLSFHHLVMDGWSIARLLADVVGQYREGTSPSAPSYARHLHFLGRLDREGAGRFFEELLGGAPPLTALPSEGVGRTSRIVEHSVTVTNAEVVAAARETGTTPAQWVAGAYALSLGTFGRSRDVVLGQTVSGRPADQPESADTVGLFINTVPMRVRWARGDTPRTLVSGLHRAAIERQPYEHTPLRDALREGGIRDVEALFVYENYPVDDALRASAGVSPGALQFTLTRSAETTHYPLVLTAVESSGQLTLRLQHDARRAPDEWGVAFVRVLTRWLDALVAAPDAPLSRVQLATGDDRARDASQRAGEPGLVLDAIARSFARRDDEALAFQGATRSYADLDRESAALAATLRKSVRAGSRVGIFLERGFGMVEAVIGIWRAGGAYLPLDPTLPDARLHQMIRDAGPVVVITSAALASRLPPEVAFLTWDDVDRSKTPPFAGARCHPSAEAYVIYTSGSTGRPKGVSVSHGALATFAQEAVRLTGLSAADRVAALTTLSFDISLLELIVPLTVGASVDVLPEPMQHDPAALANRLEAATFFQATPATWQMLLSQGWVGREGLRAVCGGEALTLDLARRLAPCVDTLWNMYGPTEATVWCSGERVPPEAGVVTLGERYRGTRAWILDEELNPLPVGVPGDLYLSGPQLAHGYHGRAALTAEHFVPSPLCEAGGRMYATGDVARRRADGRLEYLGRTDLQVKLRGFRIELGEIESVLTERGDVDQAVVVVRAERLCAYLTGSGAIDLDAIRADAAARLPQYMVPTTFTVLAEFPRTPSGKLDRRALPDPIASAEGFAAPRGREVPLAALFSELLGVERVGRDDDFFALGGHSLMATRLVARVASELGVGLMIRDVFDHPTLREMAACLEARRPLRIPPLRHDASRGPVLASYAQQRMWTLHRLAPASTAYHVPALYSVESPLDVDSLASASIELATRHEALRTAFEERDGVVYQRVGPARSDCFEFRDLIGSENARERAMALAAERISRPFDLAAGEVFRVGVYRTAADSCVLAVCVHHIACDGASLQILAEELLTLYAAFVAAEPSPLPPLSHQYRDFASWQRSWMEAGELQRQLGFWTERLAGVEPLALPLDRARAPREDDASGRVRHRFGSELVERLRAFASQAGTTPYVVWLAGLAALLSRMTRQEDIPIGTAVANRRAPELEPLIGFFVNTLVQRIDLSGRPSFEELVARAHRTALLSQDNQDAPFELVVEACGVERTMRHAPLFQVALVYHNEASVLFTPSTEALALTALDPPAAASHDLVLHVPDADAETAAVLLYREAAFDRETAESVLHRLETLLGAALAEPTRRLLDHDLRDPADRAPTLPGGRRHEASRDDRREVARDRERLAPAIFDGVVSAHGDAIAVSHAGVAWSYRRLDARADAIADALVSGGVAAGSLVGILMERGPELVASILALWKLGAGYLPLDPTLPPARLRFMARDAEIACVLSSSAFERAMADVEISTVVVHPEHSGPHRDPSVHPDAVAYVIYTSGSTGTPKGVAIPHRGVANLVAAQRMHVPVTTPEVVLNVFSHAFDGFVWDFLRALMNGGKLVLAPKSARADVSALRAILREERVSHATLPPLVWSMLESTALPSLQYGLSVGSEYLPELRGAWGQRLGNGYGPTENTVCATLAQLDSDDVHLGRAALGVECLVLDDRLRECPAGIPGELHLGGRQLALGYPRRAALTAERFVPHPTEPGERMYRTGDLVRRRANGTLVFLGRVDDQVKIRGHRVEMGEVESVLRDVDGVEDAAVVPTRDGTNLLAFVAPDAGALHGLQVDWAALFAAEYAAQESRFGGWRSAFDGQPIPLVEMEAWLTSTVRRLEPLSRGRRVLDAGCGSGLVVHEIAPGAAHYLAIDFAAPAIDRLRADLEGKDYAAHVRTRCATLDEIESDERWDLVILNSVVQYLASEDELRSLLAKACSLLSPEGAVFIGDVRDARQALALAHQVARSQRPGLPLERTRDHALLALGRDPELLAHPFLFQEAATRAGLACLCRPREMGVSNELSTFRYDVLLVPQTVEDTGPSAEWEDEEALVRDLRRGARRIRGIVHPARAEAAAGLNGARASHGLLPEAAVALAASAGFDATTLETDDPTRFDLVSSAQASCEYIRPASPLTSEPRLLPARGRILANVRERIEHRLPAYMRPATVEVLQAIPRGLSGKIDRAALPQGLVDEGRSERPLEGMEVAIGEIWREVLSAPRVGPDDDFFALGGHSLTATRMVERVVSSLDRELSVRALFDHPTLEAFARQVAAAPVRRTVAVGAGTGKTRVRVEMQGRPVREMVVDSERLPALVEQVRARRGKITILEEED